MQRRKSPLAAIVASYLAGLFAWWGLVGLLLVIALGGTMFRGMMSVPPEAHCGQESYADRALYRLSLWGGWWVQAAPEVAPACVQVPRRSLAAGHRVGPDDVEGRWLGLEYRAPELLANGGIGRVLVHDVRAREFIYDAMVAP
jgi:hypothetical protein